MKKKGSGELSRRDFLKVSGAAMSFLGAVGAGA
ncbi:MAG TPA: twin-arginine translocation signal domain-containing protein [Anaerolineales bacterium]